MLSAADENPGQRRNVAVISAPSERDMISRTYRIVCRIDIQPDTVTAISGQPRMRCIGTDQSGPDCRMQTRHKSFASDPAQRHGCCDLSGTTLSHIHFVGRPENPWRHELKFGRFPILRRRMIFHTCGHLVPRQSELQTGLGHFSDCHHRCHVYRELLISLIERKQVHGISK